MASITVLNQKTRIETSNHDAVAATLDAISAHTRVQLANLCADFFDEVDDFLFASGSKGTASADSTYLLAMRELRTKQSLFDEAFLNISITTLYASRDQLQGSNSDYAQHLVERHSEIFEMMEIDLALQAMQRKANKFYAPYGQQLNALFTRLQFKSGCNSQLSYALVNASLWAFGEAQRVFALPLDIRLVVIKLFEQHFLLKLESLYLDTINIVKNGLATGNDANCLLAGQQIKQLDETNDEYALTRIFRTNQSKEVGRHPLLTIESAVDLAVSKLIATPLLPEFIIDMIRCHWRSVLFLIGLNRGCEGYEWQEAEHTIQSLVAGTTGQSSISSAELETLLEQLQKGFCLLHLPDAEQEAFLLQTREQLGTQIRADERTAVALKESIATTPVPEASISPRGKEFLDPDDLDDIANLLGADSVDSSSNTQMEKKLLDCLPAIDKLDEEVVVEYRINGSFQTCSLHKNLTKPGMFNIIDQTSKTTITRSRLGLAISLHEGELKLTGFNTAPNAAQKTLIDKRAAR